MMTNMLLGIGLAAIGILLIFRNQYLTGTGPIGKVAIPVGAILLGVGLYLGVFG